jgi:hypothetical protein
VKRLTAAALAAAEQGRWDLVDRCYRERGQALQRVVLHPVDAERLLAIDRDIRERVLVAQAAVLSLLSASSAVRGNLQGLRHSIGVMPSSSGKLRLEG